MIEIILLITITVIGAILSIQDYKHKEVGAVLCYVHLFLVSLSLCGSTEYWVIFVVIALLPLFIIGFNIESKTINLIDLIYIIETAGIIILLKTVENSKIILLPLLIMWFIYIAIEKLGKQKFEENIPFLTICCPLISIYLGWYFFL